MKYFSMFSGIGGFEYGLQQSEHNFECERLQGFPDNWTKYGKDNELISDTQRYKCCGNAVTTNVITAIINEMFEKVKE